MKHFRIKEIKQPHYPTIYQVQNRSFGTWGFWINSGYRNENGIWCDAIFYSIKDAEEYIEEELQTPHSKKIVKEV